MYVNRDSYVEEDYDERFLPNANITSQCYNLRNESSIGYLVVGYHVVLRMNRNPDFQMEKCAA